MIPFCSLTGFLRPGCKQNKIVTKEILENFYDDPAQFYNATDDDSRVQLQPVHKR